MLKIGTTIEIEAHDIDYLGQGVARYNDFIIFTKGLLEGEKAIVKITRIKKRFAFAEIEKLITRSTYRKEEKIKLDSLDLGHLTEEKQILWQEKTVRETLDKVSDIEIDIKKTISDDNYYNYRNKVVYHTLRGDVLKLGMYSNNKLVEVNNFILANEKSNEILKYINSLNLEIKDNPIKHIVIRNNSKDEFILTIVSSLRKFKELDTLVEKLIKFPSIKTITINVNKNPRQILGKYSNVIYGDNLLIEKYNNAQVYFNDLSFLQTNYNIANKLYDKISTYIDEKDIVIDAYSGVGSIGFSIASKAEYVYLLEINDDSYNMMKKSKKDFNYENTKVLHGSVDENILKTKGNVLIVDPPRFGLTKTFVDVILEKEFEKVIYLSCDVKTQARDLKLLSEKYKIEEVMPVKMFYQTTSIENLVILKKK